eukprot:GFUD01112598.1.p2 GENE.GFUD01112598.1~~GFUD01112598.1.p2  ORF type:complete len:112 (+),score=24.71 GFUD01112598.1:114-449(+)
MITLRAFNDNFHFKINNYKFNLNNKNNPRHSPRTALLRSQKYSILNNNNPNRDNLHSNKINVFNPNFLNNNDNFNPSKVSRMHPNPTNLVGHNNHFPYHQDQDLGGVFLTK